MVYGEYNDSTRKMPPDKVLCDKAFETAKNIYEGYHQELALMVYKHSDKTFWC